VLLSDENFQRYTKALYPAAAFLVLAPIVDLMLRVFPPQFGSLQWRFGTIGLMLAQFGTVLLGLGLIGLVAAFNAHTGVLRALGYVALVGAALTLAALALFALDAIQIRTLATNPQAKRALLVSSAEAMFSGLFGTFVLFTIGRGALAASRRSSPAMRRARSAASPRVVAGQGAGEA
jgi:hypothetical protein